MRAPLHVGRSRDVSTQLHFLVSSGAENVQRGVYGTVPWAQVSQEGWTISDDLSVLAESLMGLL